MSDDTREDPPDRVSKAVARALALVGPSERGTERASEDRPADTPVS
jgi:hypothetical protein